MKSFEKYQLEVLGQAVRKSHCSKYDENGHECVGVCTITPKGVELSCKLCGDEKENIAPSLRSGEVIRARQILGVAGLDYDHLSPFVQRSLVDELLKDFCPGCGMRHDFRQSHIHCSCNKYNRSNMRGWQKSQD